MSLDLRQLECFVAVAEEGNIGRAAERLHMTQPPLTRRIQRLEREIGAPLLRRTPRGVETTAAGEALIEQARRILAMTQRAVDVTRAADQGLEGQLVVAYFGSTIFSAIPSLLSGFSAAHPGIDVRLERVAKPRQVDALRDGRLHIGFSRLYAPEKNMTVIDLIEEGLFLAVSVSHPFSERESLSVKDLQGQEHVLFPHARPSFADEVVRMCAVAGFQPNVIREAEDAVTALADVSIGNGVAVVPSSATRIALPGLAFVPLIDAFKSALSCIYRTDDDSPVLATLLHFLGHWTYKETV